MESAFGVEHGVISKGTGGFGTKGFSVRRPKKGTLKDLKQSAMIFANPSRKNVMAAVNSGRK